MPAFDPSGAAPSEHQARQFGDNNDGMEFFPLSSDRAVLVVNNEFPNYRHLFPHRGRRLSADDVVKAQNASGSDNVNPGNRFNSPDGIGFDSQGRLWIQTDGDDSDDGDFLGMGNNQMLCGDPESGEIRRFLTGPVGCEITGLAFSPDSTALFVGIQHPGESPDRTSHFPDGGSAKPRSTVAVITRRDGGIIGT